MAAECEERSVLCWDYNQGMAISAGLGTSDSSSQKDFIQVEQIFAER